MIPWDIVDTAFGPDGTKLVLARRGLEWEVSADRATLMSSRAHGSEEELAARAFQRVPGAARVLIGGLGLGYSLRAALDLLPPHGRATVAELSPNVVSWNRSHVAHLAGRPLDDPRAQVYTGDVRKAIAETGPYDAILLDVDNGPTALVHDGNVGLYTPAGIAACFGALSAGGALAVWSLESDENYLRRLKKAGFDAACHWVRARAGGKKRHALFLAVKPPRPRSPSGTGRLSAMLVSAALALPCLAVARPPQPSAKKPPNVILLTLDTTRADRLGCYGHAAARTPTLDRLAREGARFESAFSSVPNTLPSHATMLTGRYPFHTGVRDNLLYSLPDSATTLAETLKGQGYRTQAFVSAAVLDRVFGLQQGFDVYDDRIVGAPGQGLSEDRTAAAVGAAVLGQLAGLQEPYFLWVHYYDPHEPYSAPRPFGDDRKTDPYDAEIAYMDSEIGKLLARLSAKGLLRDTVIAVVADHGQSLGEHGEKTHGVFLYDSALRVPLILWAPGRIPGATVVRGLASTVDLLPTILDYAGVKTGEPLDGVSLRAAVASGQTRVEAVYQESFLPQNEFGWSPLHGLRTPQWHFVLAPRKELYDVRNDPAEVRNVLDANPGAARTLEASLRRLPFALAARTPPAVSEELQERIASLGYVSSERTAQAQPGMDPKDGIALLGQLLDAEALLGKGQAQKATPMLDAILARNPENVPARVLLGRAHLQRRGYEAARQQFSAALQYSPLASLHLDLAVALVGLGRFREAEEQYRLALVRNPRQPRAYASWAELELRQGKQAEAAKVLKQAQDAGVQSADLHVLRGRLAASRREFDEAIRSFQQARAETENPTVAEIYLGLAYLETGQLDAAVAPLEAVLRRDPKNAAALRMRGDIAYAKRETRAARGYYERFLTLAPSDGEAARIRERVKELPL